MVKREPVRLSGAVLLERNLFDSVTVISSSVIYLLCCATLPQDTSYLKFLVIFLLFCGLFHYHLESYRSFIRVRKYASTLDSDDKPALRDFLSIRSRYHKPNHIFQHPTDKFMPPWKEISNQNRALAKSDSYSWVNQMISFFWPYLSHVVHHELNEFLSNSGSLARSDVGFKRLLYAFIKHIDANILAVEHCQLGSNAPYVRGINVSRRVTSTKSSSSLVYDLDLIYEGNMNISFICRYFCCCTSRLGLKDVFVHLDPRIVIGPIDSDVPAIEKISFSLIRLPKFGYKGIALVELARLRMAKRSINRLIRDHLLDPKAISLKFEDLVTQARYNQSETLQVDRQPGRIEPSRDNISNQPDKLPWTTRLLARLMFCACMCSNFCLMCCQKERLNRHSRRLERLRI